MRDIPFFTTDTGVASVTLSQIPYTKTAYIRIQTTSDPKALLEECVGFCRAAGAEVVFATGHSVCKQYPFYTDVVKMRADVVSIGETDALLFPVTQETAHKWQSIYNDKVKNVPNGAWMDNVKMQEVLKEGSGYFVHRNEQVIGIGCISYDQIHWVASVLPGAGRDVVRALLHGVTAETVFLEVASANKKAVSLYLSLGFIPTEVLSSWYCVYKK